MRYLKVLFALMLVILLFILSPVQLLAKPDIRLGPVRAYPGLTIKGDYTDNYFLYEREERDEWITTITPELLLQLPMRRHMLQLEYRTDYFAHAKYTYADVAEHFVGGFLNLDFPGGLKIKAGHEYRITSYPPLYYSKDPRLRDPRHKYRSNKPNGTISYRFADRYEVEVSYYYQNAHFKIERDRVDDYGKHDVAFTLFYRILPKTWILAEAGYYRMNRPTPLILKPIITADRDSDNYRAWLGLRWEPGAKLVGTIKGGYIARRYDDKEGGKDEDNFGLRCELEYYLTPYDQITLTASREVLETYITTMASPYFGSSYISSGFDLDLKHRFTYKISGSLRAHYTNDNYHEAYYLGGPERMDNRYIFGGSIDYQIQDWLSCGLGYHYLNNDSNYDWQEYDENRVMLYISASFPELKP